MEERRRNTFGHVHRDSKSLYDCLVKLGTTREKRLMVDLMYLRQAYERREVKLQKSYGSMATGTPQTP